MSSTRRFEMVEGSSSKFWEVSVDGASFTVAYGRIGTPGTRKSTACASPEVAAAEAEKLIREKLKKGYSEAGGPKNWRPPAHISPGDHVRRFMNYAVSAFNPDADGEGGDDEGGRRELPALRELDRRVFSVGIDYDSSEEDYLSRLDALLADPRIGELRGLVIGVWYGEVCEDPPSATMERLIAAAPRLKALGGLFLGDVVQEESEISWLHQGDCGPMLNALPSSASSWSAAATASLSPSCGILGSRA